MNPENRTIEHYSQVAEQIPERPEESVVQHDSVTCDIGGILVEVIVENGRENDVPNMFPSMQPIQ